MSTTPDWTQFTKRITIRQPLAVVYAAWSIPSKLTSWFLEEAKYTRQDGTPRPADEPIQKGDHHVWKWHNWDIREEGLVLEANGTDQLGFTFGHGGNVHIQLTPVEGGTEVSLTQSDIPTDEMSKMNYYQGCSTGWTFWMTNLKAWLEHGFTLNATGLSKTETANLVNS